MPLGKKTKLSKSANEQALADQLNVASYAFLQIPSEAKRACWLAGHAVFSRHYPATPGAVDEAD